MRTLWMILVLLVGVGCRESAPSAAPDSAHEPSTSLYDPSATTAHGEFIPAMFELTLDPATLAASLTPLPSRGGTGFQATQYDLDPQLFLKPDTLRISDVRWQDWDDLALTFTHTHPYAAPDLGQPASVTNRADLGYTGRLVLLADLPAGEVGSHTFFGDVVANTSFVKRADGYVRPGPLLGQPSGNANTFPYMLLADEAKDNRLGLSNGSDLDFPPYTINGTGNYDPAVGGWPRDTLAAGAMGYDLVHQGQVVTNQVVVNGDALTSQLSIRLALLIKYTQPKAVAGPSLRLPPLPEDPLQFAYRLPHAAMDVPVVELPVENDPNNPNYLLEPSGIVQIPEGSGGAATVSLGLRDWDARAVEATGPDVSVETEVALVEPGTSGAPLSELHCPGLSASYFALGPTSTTATGAAGDEIPYEGQVTNDFGVGSITDWPALVRFTDPQSTAPPGGSPRLGLDPVTLAGDPAKALEPVTYQALTFRVVPALPQWQVMTVDPSTDNGGYANLIVVDQGTPDPTDDRLLACYYDFTLTALKVAVATSAAPATSADWAIYVVDDSGDVGHGARMVLWNNCPVITYADHTNEAIRLARATVPLPLDPLNWDLTVIYGVTPGEFGTVCTDTAVTVNALNQLVVAYVDTQSQNVVTARTVSATPSEPGDWISHILDAVFGGTGSGSLALARWGDGLALTYNGYTLGPWGEYVAMSRTPTPNSAGEWIISALTDEVVSGRHEFAPGTGPRPWIGAGAYPRLYRPRPPLPDSVTDWDGHRATALTNNEAGRALTERDGRLLLVLGAVRFGGEEGLHPQRALLAQPEQAMDWQHDYLLLQIDWNDGVDVVTYQDRYVISFRGEGADAHLRLAYNLQPW